jgi:hypothetical protein
VLVSGDGQAGEAGTTLSMPVVVMVTDTSGHALADRRVTFAVTGGGGVVDPWLPITNRNGYAEITWTLGPSVGPQTLTASVGLVPSVITVNATAGPPKLAIVGDPSYYFYGLTQSLGIGQYTPAWVGPARIVTLGAPLTVSFSHVGTAYTNVPASVTIQAGASFFEFQIAATSVGTDSIVASAPGYAPVTMGFVVDSGGIQFGLNANPPISPSAGGVKEVYLCIYPGLSVEPVTFSLAADPNIGFASENTPLTAITSITVPANQSCAYFLVQGLAAGPGRVTITSPNYRTFSSAIVVTP